MQLEKRTAFGSQGRPVNVLVNCFRLSKQPDGMVQHYDVNFSVDCQEKRLYIKWLLQHPKQKKLGPDGEHAVYDGKANLYVLSSKKIDSATFNVDEGQARGKESPKSGAPRPNAKPLTVTLNHVAHVNMFELGQHVIQQANYGPNVMQAIAALNLAMKQAPSSTFPSKANTFYIPPNSMKESDRRLLSGGLEVWRGYFTSIRPAMNKTVFVFDTSAGSFKEAGSVIDVLMRKVVRKNDVTQINILSKTIHPKDRVKITRFLKNLTITVKPRGEKQKYKIKKISKDAASSFMFELEDGKQQSVQKYIEQKYNCKLKYPYLPVVQVTKMAWYPLELCDIVWGATFYGKLEPDQVAEMLKTRFTTMKPSEKLDSLREGLRYLQLQSSTFRHWNLDIEQKPLTIKARILEPPRLSYSDAAGKPSVVMPRDGGWDLRGKKAAKSGKRIERWMVVVFADNNASRDGFPLPEVQQSVRSFAMACKEWGLNIINPQPLIFHAGGNPNVPVQAAFVQASKLAGFGAPNPPQFVVTYTNKGSRAYGAIKHIGEVALGVATQNMLIQKARNAKPTYYANVALKVNVKLEGVNQTIQDGPQGFKEKPTIVFGADVTHPGPGSMLPSIAAIVASHDLQGTSWTTQTRVQKGGIEIIEDLESVTKSLIIKFRKKTNKQPQRIIFYRDGVSEGQFDAVCRDEIGAMKAACAALPNFSPTLIYIICAKRHHIRSPPYASENKHCDVEFSSFAHHIAARARLHIGADDDDSISSSGSGSKEDIEKVKDEKLKWSRDKLKPIHENLVDSMYFM
ncbi:MAG: hypothetical protein CYPHOPRED_001225 [Cyphobasidiales sp. Tagirdzhanova-0007]|nr:MAG: hypothetical protein CYPHOPRED_001225 [Cyphobasidiales sp. Tagirdzhanova-0007]